MSADTELGLRITEARTMKNYSVSDIARLIGVTEKTVRKWESGKKEPRSNRFQMLAGVLGVPLGWLLDGSGDFDHEVPSTDQLRALGLKIDRMAKLQQELVMLSDEIVAEVAELQQIEEDLAILRE